MSNNQNQNNSNYRPANSSRRDYVVHKFDNLWFVRNLEQGKGSADILATSADAIVIGVTAEGVLAKNSLAERVMSMYNHAIGREYIKQVSNGLRVGQVVRVPVETKEGVTKTFLLMVIKETLDDTPTVNAIARGLWSIHAAIKSGVLKIESLAIQKLGVGKTQLDWTTVGTTFAYELSELPIRCSIFGIKWDEDVYVKREGEIVAFTRQQCMERNQQAAMERRPVITSSVLESPAEEKPAKVKKERKVRKPRAPKAAPVSTEAKEEPCGMFRDVPSEFATSIPAADQALNVMID